MNNQYAHQHEISPTDMSPHMTSQLSPYKEITTVPAYIRSNSGSPERLNLNDGQRELQRRRDLVPRGSKGRSRRERSLSTPYNTSQRPSPELSQYSTISQYQSSTLSPPTVSSNSSQTIPSPPYLAAYSSQQFPSQDDTLYGAPIYSLSPNEYTSMASYSLPYSKPSSQSNPSSFA